MKTVVKNIVIMAVCVLVILFVYAHTVAPQGSGTQGGIPQDNAQSTMPRGRDSFEDNKIEEEDSWIVDDATSSTSPFTTDPSTPQLTTSTSPPQQGEFYELEKPQGKRIGSSGLLPATVVSVVTNRTERSVNFDTCTVAFSLPASVTGTKRPWAVTAGHCGKPGQKVYSRPTGGDFSTARYLGVVRYTSDSDENKGTSDWGVISLNPKAIPPRHSTRIPLVLDTYPRKVGKTICKNGGTTGFTCGDKGKDDVRTQVSQDIGGTGGTVSRMTQAHFCALPGDSGAPVFDRDGIIGILSSTSASSADAARRKCSPNNISYYVPIDKFIKEITAQFPRLEL